MKKIILITGGAGFIGSNFIHYMLNKYPEYEIVNLDKLTYAGNLENLKEVENNKNYHFVKGDITNRELVEHIFEEFNPQYVVNFAAESHVDRSIEGPEIFVKTNVYGTHVLLDVAKEYWEKKKMEDVRFIQISTDEVYGSLPLESKEKFTEESPLRPNSPYSATKAGADLICRSYFITYNFPVIITRSSNNFGPRQYPEKLIPLTIKRALEGKPIPVYGDGQNVRDWIYVEDNCKGIDLVLHKGRIGEIYNIGGGNEWKNIDLVNLICGIIAEIKGEDAERYKRLITFVKDRPGHDRRYALSIEKIKSELGWKPESDFLEALKFTVRWYMERWEGII
ncbi:dTDP-glucose 4,6-dehydratase [Dictyoglomus thermophilum]|uniref:dTDP-glucose 4,6-dehydratase n=1 Tax=Dictyoglomus thermophilum TaxID=14 RepID=UPI0011EB230A|nr:dTDP-glucose 4,6-dehydratase [Dictyoglomus thermophilum]TYT21027.1 dTDP-glucose 4,6-dehydratase [Dictyoglomus thermophilum]